MNGRARLVSDAPFLDDPGRQGPRAPLALVVEVEQAFHHCGKAFLRSEPWTRESWASPDLRSCAAIFGPWSARTLIRRSRAATLVYAENLYRLFSQ